MHPSNSRPLDQIPHFREVTSWTSGAIQHPSLKQQALVNQVAQEVIAELSNPNHEAAFPSAELKDLTQFIHQFERMNPDGSSTLKQLHHCQSLCRAQMIPSSINPVEQRKQIQERIACLNLSSPHLREEVRLIKQDLEALKPYGDAEHIEMLQAALTSLVDPSGMKISSVEFALVRELCQRAMPSSPQRQIDAQLSLYSEQERDSIRNGQEQILEELQQANQKGFDTVLQAAEGLIENVQEQVMLDRLQQLDPAIALSPAMQWIASDLVGALGEERQRIREEMHAAWTSMLSEEVLSHFGSLSDRQAFFDVYPFLNPKADIETIADQSIARHLEQLPLDGSDLDVLETSPLASEHMGALSDLLVSRADQIGWMIEQRPHLAQAYSQSSDPLTEGACFSNSLYRASKMHTDPTIPLEAGATPETRMRQHQYIFQFLDSPYKGSITDIRSQQLTEGYQLQLVDMCDIAFTEMDQEQQALFAQEEEKIKKIMEGPLSAADHAAWAKELEDLHVVQQALQKTSAMAHKVDSESDWNGEVDRFAQKHPSMILFLQNPLTHSSHVINVQIDEVHGCFRFVDDEVGVLQFETREELHRALFGLITHFYPEYGHFQLRAYEPVSAQAPPVPPPKPKPGPPVPPPKPRQI